MNTLEIQQALHAKGFDPGAHDGIRGRRTIAAIEAFQAANGLVVDGIVGPKTAAALFTTMKAKEKAAVDPTLPWYAEAWGLEGLREMPGSGDEPRILQMAEDLDIPYGDDEIPWCGLFVAHCIGSQLIHEPLPTTPLLARSWLKFGTPVDPQPGAVMVFWRGDKHGSLGHVGFYTGEDKRTFHILGGNQSDKVCVTKFPKDRLLGARWPATAMPPAGKARIASDARLLETVKED
jgi:uncharacterized protein (TIGR02594 family)